MRKPMVTRTIKTTLCHCLTLDADNNLNRIDYVIAGAVPIEKALKLVQKEYPNDYVVKVVGTETLSDTYGIPVVDFMKAAVRIVDTDEVEEN